MQSDRHLLVTGGTGFLGARFVALLVNHRTENVHILTRGAGVSRHGNVTNVCADLCRGETLDSVCRGAMAIFHFAGNAHNVLGDDDSLHAEVTVEGTRNLLEAARKAGVSQFIFISSVKAIGEGGPQLFDELSPLTPTTAYGRAKREAERLVLEAGQRYGMHVCNLRLSMVYGVGMKGNLPRMIEAIDRGRFPPLPNSNNDRSMVWVDDVVQAALLAADKPEANGQTYIVTDDEAYSTRRIYEAICRALNKPVPRWAVPMMGLQVAAKIGDVIGALRRRRFPFDSEALDKLLGSAHYSSAKISRELGYQPTKNLEAVLPEIIAAMRAHGLVHR